MTDLIITAVGDATLRSARPSLPDASGDWIYVKSAAIRGLLLPELDNIAGRTVLAATYSGRVGPGLVAQTFTLTPYTARRSPGNATWTNEPAVNSAAATATAVGALPTGSLVEWNVQPIIQAVADGTSWFGLQLKTNSTATGQKFYATDSGDPAWELHITLSDAPEQPSDLRPDGGGAVNDGEPILAWAFVDLGGTSTEQADSKVQVDTPAAGLDPDGVTPDFDSGWVANTDPEYDLSTATYTSPGAGPTYWRVRVRDGAGIQSDWSDWAEFTVAALPTLVVDSPVGAFGDPTPQVLAHLTGGTVSSWTIKVTGSDRSDVRAVSEVQTGAVDWTVPFRNADGRRVLKSSETGWIYLRVYDNVDRAVAVGQKTYADAWISADLNESVTPTAPTNLSVEQVAEGDPRSLWSWRRTEAADGWIVEVDDDEMARLEPEDVTLDGGVYTWTDSGEITPLRPHTLRVRALEGTEKSRGPELERTHTVKGVWLLRDGGEPIVLAGTAVEGFARVDRAATYVPLRGPEIDIIYDTPPRTGTFEGTVDSRRSDDEVWAVLDEIETLRASRNRRVRMVWGSQSVLVRLRDPDATSHGAILPASLLHVVRFGFVQVGE